MGVEWGLMYVDDEELALLRLRAYGPNADIESDPDAFRRLRDLDEQRRTPQDESDVQDDSAPHEERAPRTRESTTSVESETGHLEDEPDAPHVVSEQQVPARLTRRRGWVVLGALAAIVVAGTAFWLGRTVGLPQPDRVFNENLRESPDSIGRLPTDEWLVDAYGVRAKDERWQGQIAEDMDVWTARTAEGNRCVIVSVDSDDGNGGKIRVVWGVSCADTLEPMVDLPGDALDLAKHPELGQAQLLRFVWRSDGVALFVDPGAGERSAISS